MTEQLKAEREAFEAYLKDCDDYCIQTDAASAFAFAWRAAQAQRADVQVERNAISKDHPLASGVCIHSVRMSDHCAACAPRVDPAVASLTARVRELEAELEDAQENVELLAPFAHEVIAMTTTIARLEAACKQAEEALQSVYDDSGIYAKLAFSSRFEVTTALQALREKGVV